MAAICKAGLCLLSLSGLWAAGFRPAAEPHAYGAQDLRFGVKVEMVSLYATVHDRDGRLVTNLGQGDFVVYDNDAPQTLSRFSRDYMPLSVVILLDTSSSMVGRKLDSARDSLLQFLKRLNRGDEAMLITFNSRPVKKTEFTSDLDRIRRSLRRLEGIGSTALYDAVLLGLAQSGQAGHRRRMLLLLSDGMNTYGSAELRGTIAELRRGSAELFAIGLESDLPEELTTRAVTRAVLEQLTASAGGEAFIAVRPRDLARVCREISDRMHHQYTFAYYPAAINGPQWRSVRIESRIPGLRIVPSKTGYFPAAGSGR